MFELHETSARSVAASSRAAVMEIDTAYVKQLRLAADAVETIQASGMPAGQSQKLLRAFHTSVGKLIEGRRDLVSAIGQMQVIHKNSNIAETDLGCEGPWFATPLVMARPVADAAQNHAIAAEMA